MNGQTFIFCLGATKAGTSWLFDYLHGHEECHFSAVKEMHYFDALETGQGAWYRTEALSRLERTRANLAQASSARPMLYLKKLDADLERWLATFDGQKRDDAAYLEYIQNGGEDARIVGDFTPAYGLLSEGTLRTMAGLTGNVRFIYLMRDPVERLWSNIRMISGSGGPAALKAKVEAVLKGTAENVLERSNYRRTLNRISRVVGRENLHIEFYERLFTPDAIDRICAFLGITPQMAKFENVVHQSVKADLSEGQRAQLQAVLNPQYNFVEKFMGELPSEWTQKMVSA